MSPLPSSAASVHVPVLMREVLKALALAPGLTVVDGTFGGGGHSRKILEQLGSTGRLIGLDRDPVAIERAPAEFSLPHVSLLAGSYVDLPAAIEPLEISSVDRILVDLGLSSDQLADAERGFSFQSSGALDLRFDGSQGPTAAELIASTSEEELGRLLSEYGEEPAARKIAAALIAQRSRSPIKTVTDLNQVVESVLGHARGRDKHPATRVFQALRITVNRELEHVSRALDQAFPQVLAPGGLLVVITFHSLEDRLVKEAFRRENVWEVLTPRPIEPSPAEVRVNPRSRSAKLRVARRTANPLPEVNVQK